MHVASLLSFLITAAALIGLAHLMAESTSIIANRVSSTISALINATFGNAVELFIAIFSLRAGLFALVTASITGSILLNVLLLIGLAMLAGGLKFKEQKFNKDSAGLSSTMLFVAVVGLGLPSMYKMMVGTPSHANEPGGVHDSGHCLYPQSYLYPGNPPPSVRRGTTSPRRKP